MADYLSDTLAGGRGRCRRISCWTAALGVCMALIAGEGSAEERRNLDPAMMIAGLPQSVDAVVFGQIPVEPAGGEGGLRAAFLRGKPIPDASRIVVLDRADPASEVINLTPGFAAAGRPDLSFDARRILFVGRQKPTDVLSVWEMNVDGSAVRRVVGVPTGCDDAIYLSTIYTIDAQQPAHQIAFRTRALGESAASLYTCRLDGSWIRRITFSPQNVVDPCLLSDGRMVVGVEVGGVEFGDGDRHGPGTALFTLHVDGTELSPFAGVHEPVRRRAMPCETSDGRIVYVESELGSGDSGGTLVAVSRMRSLHTRRVIVGDAKGVYHSPSRMPDGNLLVSYRSRNGGSYGLFVLDPSTGERVARVFDSPRWHEVGGVALVARPEPAGRSSVVNYEVGSAQLYCLDAYISDTPEGARIEPGKIKRLRVIQASTRTGNESSRALSEAGDAGGTDVARRTHLREVVLGEVPVEQDGSFFLEVPAQIPLRLESLDEQGDVLQAMSSWIWLMPSERRGCIGCHEDRERTPPNRHVMALRKRPITVGVLNSAARIDEDTSRLNGGYGR